MRRFLIGLTALLSSPYAANKLSRLSLEHCQRFTATGVLHLGVLLAPESARRLEMLSVRRSVPLSFAAARSAAEAEAVSHQLDSNGCRIPAPGNHMIGDVHTALLRALEGNDFKGILYSGMCIH